MPEGADNAGIVVGMYAPMAADYEAIWAPLLRVYGIRMLDRLPLAGAARVLDLGCGVGTLLPDIRARAADALVVGVDLTEEMLGRAGDGATVAVMDGTRLAFADASFDAIVSCFVVFHFPDPRAALAGVRRVLRPGGAFTLSVWGRRWDFPAADAWEPVLDARGAGEDFAASGAPDGEDAVNTPEKLADVLEGAGFTEVRTETSAWEQPWDLEGFMGWGERMGPTRRRLATLPVQERRAVVDEVRSRVAALLPEALVQRYEVVLGSGRAPA
jgi:SAM-dependent methyltransferase